MHAFLILLLIRPHEQHVPFQLGFVIQVSRPHASGQYSVDVMFKLSAVTYKQLRKKKKNRRHDHIACCAW